MTQEEIQKNITEMPSYMPITDIERQLGMPATTLQKAAKGERTLPTKWIKPLQDFFGLKKPLETTPAGIKTQETDKTAKKQPLATSQPPKKTAKVITKEPVPVVSGKTYADYMKMSGVKIKEHWDEIKKSKLTPGQRSTLYSKISK